MKKTIIHYLKPPKFENSELQVLAGMLIGLATGLICLSLFFILTVALFVPNLFTRTVLIGGIMVTAASLTLVLIHRRKIQPASILLIGSMWLLITLGSITAGGVSAPIFMGYLVVLMAINLIPNNKIAIGISLGCVATGFLIALADLYGLLPAAAPHTTITRFSIYLFFFLVTIFLLYINKTNLQALLTQAVDNEQKYKSLLENIPITTYINTLGEESFTEYVSPQVEALLGYPRSIYSQDPGYWKKILHPEDYERVISNSSEGAQTGIPFDLEYRLITNDGRIIWVKDEANLVHDQAGKPLYWLGVWTDITSRKQAEESQADLVSEMTKRTIQLQTAAEVSRAASSILDLTKLLPNVVELIRSHFDYYYVGIFLVDNSGEWATLSAATGTEGKKMLGIGHRLKIEDSSMIGWCINNRQARIALDAGEDSVRFRNPLLPLTRSEMALPLTAHGNVIGAMTIQSALPFAFSRVDIANLQTMADQIAITINNASLFTERTSLIEELEARNAELEQFTYTVSHDLRSPLVTIRGFLGYLRQDAASGDMPRFEKDLNRIANAVDKMQYLLNDLLELSRVGRVINPPEQVPFLQIVSEAVELLSGVIEKHAIQLVVPEILPTISGDHPRLIEVMQNLIGNAAKFMGDQKQPTVEIGLHGNDTDHKPIFFVRDNGIGIDPQYHERIFGLFSRLNPDIDGTGIGLTLVKRIIEIHGGRIWLESEPGKGTVFYFTLPTG